MSVASAAAGSYFTFFTRLCCCERKDKLYFVQPSAESINQYYPVLKDVHIFHGMCATTFYFKNNFLLCQLKMLFGSITETTTLSCYYHLCISPTDAIQVQNHVQITAQLSKAVHRGAKGLDGAFWEISSSNVLEQRADEETQPAVLLCQLIGFCQGRYLLVYLRAEEKKSCD